MKKIIALATLAVVTLSLQAKNLSAEKALAKGETSGYITALLQSRENAAPNTLTSFENADGNRSGTVRLPTVGVARV